MDGVCPFLDGGHPPDEVLQLQAITRRISQLKVELNREANQLDAEGYKIATTDLIERDIQVNFRHLNRHMARLEKEAVALVLSVPHLSYALPMATVHPRHRQNQCVAFISRIGDFTRWI